MKLESGLHPEIKYFIGYQEIRRFFVLANKYTIYDEDDRERSTHYKNVSTQKDKRFVYPNCGKPNMNLNGHQSSYSNQGSTVGGGRSNNAGNGNKRSCSAGNSGGGLRLLQDVQSVEK